ncbi:MAG: ferredoxin--NADP reductase [Nocardioidaceae bacterium]
MSEESHLLPVLDIVEETADARSLVLGVPAGLEEAFAYRPGQFLTVAVPSALTGPVARCYSLSSSPSWSEDGPSPREPGPLVVTTKRTPGGYASHWLADNLRPGDRLRVLPPSGIFTPASLDTDLLMFAAGSGITPVMSIVRTVLAHGRGRVVLLYANRDAASVIFSAELDALAAGSAGRLEVEHWLETERGLPTVEALRELATPYDAWDSFCCGPPPFMAAVAEVLRGLGLPRSRRHQEKFVSLGGNPFGDAPVGPVGPVALSVALAGESHTFDDWSPDVRLLDFLEARGLRPPYSCRKGECSACVVRLTSGDLGVAHNEILDEEDLRGGLRLACQATPLSGRVGVRFE